MSYRKTIAWRQKSYKYFQITFVHICFSPNTNYNTPILCTCLTLSWSFLCSTAEYLMIPLWIWVVRVKKKKIILTSWFHGMLNFSKKIISNNFYDSHWFIENGIHHINLVKILDIKYKVNEKVRKKITSKLELAKWRQQKYCTFFKCLLNFRAHALQLGLNKVSISNFVKFWLQSMSSIIRRAFE